MNFCVWETSIKTCLKKIDALGYGSLIVVNQKFLGKHWWRFKKSNFEKNNTEKPYKNFCNKKQNFLIKW